MQRYCRQVFRRCDSDCDNMLDFGEFSGILRDVLRLDMDPQEANVLFSDADPTGTGMLTFSDFKRCFRNLLKRAHRDDLGGDEWVHVGYSSGESGAPIYFNWKTGEMIEMPALRGDEGGGDGGGGGGGYTHAEEEEDQIEFDLYVKKTDGTVLTTYMDDTGQRYYVEGDDWVAIPDDWLEELEPVEQGNMGGLARAVSQGSLYNPDSIADGDVEVDEDDGMIQGSSFTFQQPGTENEYEGAIFRQPYTFRAYYDEATDTFKPIPIEWECRIPAVTRLVQELDEALPLWQNLTEQVLALRANNYSVKDTLEWKSADIALSGGTWDVRRMQDAELIDSLEAALKSKSHQVDQLKRAARASDVIMDEQAKDSDDLHRELEEALSLQKRQTKRIQMLEEELQQQFDDSQRATTRQRTRISALETELETEIDQNKNAAKRRKHATETADGKVEQMLADSKSNEARLQERILLLETETFNAKKAAAGVQGYVDEIALLKGRLATQDTQLAHAVEGGSAPLREQLAMRTSELETVSQKYQTEVAQLRSTLEEKEFALRNSASTGEEKEVRLSQELAVVQSELESIKAATADQANISTGALKEKEDEIKRLKEQEVKLQEQTTALKRGTTKMLQKLKFELETLAKENKTLRAAASDTVGRAQKVFDELAPLVRRMARIYLDNDQECKDLRKKYQKEVLQRKLLYNKIQELKGNIRVFCRVRHDPRVPVALKFISETELMVPTGQDNRTKLYEFDKVYSPETTQAAVYEDASGIIMSCIDGYNVCFLAYGQTGSGKTWTMMGPPNNPELAGVNRRAVHDLFRMCGERDDYEYSMEISMLEIYNENVYDLLSGHHAESLRVIQTGDGGTKVENLIRRDVVSAEDVTRALEEADENRSVAATAMNAHSSRSHLLLQLVVTGFNKITGVTGVGKLSLCDLAGSERVAKSEATGARLAEAAAINKSLTNLGLIFAALGAGQKHVPYRNSKLTHILQDSLGGDSKACMFVNCSPAESNLSETRSTLNFGQGISKIELGPIKRNATGGKKKKKK